MAPCLATRAKVIKVAGATVLVAHIRMHIKTGLERMGNVGNDGEWQPLFDERACDAGDVLIAAFASDLSTLVEPRVFTEVRHMHFHRKATDMKIVLGHWNNPAAPTF
jgi:hypothetical protein